MSQPHVERTVAGYKFGHKLNGYVGGSLASHSITCLAALTKNEVSQLIRHQILTRLTGR